MALIRFGDRPEIWNPWSEFDRIRQGLDNLSHGYHTNETPFGRATVFPPLNIFAEDEGLIIKAELPGIKAEHLDISIEGDTLTIKGKRERPSSDKKISYHRQEIETGNFSRSINMPVKANPDTVTARMTDGILTITLEKAVEVKPRQIKVMTEQQEA